MVNNQALQTKRADRKIEGGLYMKDKYYAVYTDNAREISKAQGKKYSDEEIELIRDFLYAIGEIEYEHITEKQKSEQGSHLHEGVNG